jgi:hypothetical protein
MGSRHFALLGILSLLGFAFVPAGCGNRGVVEGSSVALCKPGKTACLSAEVGQICNAEGQWATFQCGTDRLCDAGACVSLGATCGDNERSCLSDTVAQLCTSDQSYVAVACSAGKVCRDGDCRDICEPNTHECASDSLLQHCRSDGTGWLKSECPTGTTCTHGACEGSCEAGTAACVTNDLLRVCRGDGTGYSEQQCPASMSCSDGRCTSNTSATCTFGTDVCLNESTLLECLRDGSGYKLRDCPSKTSCRSGKCLGTVCAAGATSCVGSTAADFTGVQTCNDDGSGYSVAICKSAGRCIQNQDSGKYECYVPPCTSGEEACVEPSAGKVSTDYLSRCEILSNGKLGWVSYKCDLPAVCKSTSATAAACHTECSPGDQRCSTDGTAVETCGTGGTWEASNCTKTVGADSMCVLVPTTKKVVCGDKDCRTLQTTLAWYTTRGRCSSTSIRLCGEDGRLSAATACAEGQCVAESDGLGTCKDPTRCQHDDGWRECIASNDAYRTCMSGHWEFTLCAEGALCTNAGEGLATCGDDCIPEKVRCVDAGFQTCTSAGTWGPTQACTTGECNPLTNHCETACVAGQLRCTGEVAVASDGTSLGSRAVQRCTSAGAWGSAQTCAATSSGDATLCRRSGMGEHIGCVRCVGPAVTGGNEEGAVDSRCNTETTGYQICQADNTWPTSTTACTGTEHCAKQRDGSITGTCSNYGCTTGKPKFCVGFETVTTAVTIDDCCSGDCDSTAGKCLHRKRHYDPTCTETTSCFTGRYDSDGASINETCCTGYCRSGQGCLKLKAKACDAVTSCAVTKVDHTNVCCGTCLTTGLCTTGTEAQHPYGEYFSCGLSSNVCWAIGSCSLASGSSTSGAMFANCIE